jgi:hypothetical protein
MMTPPAVEDNIARKIRIVLQFDSEIIQAGLLILATNVTEFIEHPGFGRGDEGRGVNYQHATANAEQQNLSHDLYLSGLRLSAGKERTRNRKGRKVRRRKGRKDFSAFFASSPLRPLRLIFRPAK